jgi:hypothetical protein
MNAAFAAAASFMALNAIALWTAGLEHFSQIVMPLAPMFAAISLGAFIFGGVITSTRRRWSVLVGVTVAAIGAGWIILRALSRI